MKYTTFKTYLILKKFCIKYLNFILYIFFAFVFTWVVLYTTLSEFSPKLIDGDVSSGWSENDKTDIEIYNFKTDYFTNNSKVWEMESKSAKIYNSKNLTKLVAVKIRYYKNGKVDGEVQADSASVKNSSRNVLLEGNVKLVNSKGTIAKGDQFRYFTSSGNIQSSKRVTITKPNGFVISGTGFSATSNLENIVFHSNVSGEVQEDINNLNENIENSF